MKEKTEIATFGAGCFWGVEAAFKKAPGIIETRVGFMGGNLDSPSYEDVVYKPTGHAEVVEVTYDPKQISYQDLLKLFWFIHNPTQLNRQGNDVGDQYRSVIFYSTEEQKNEAETAKQTLEQSDQYSKAIVTSIEPATKFWSAEEYHQKYLDKNPGGYCHVPLGDVSEFVKTLGKKNS